jgi:hypothetical protein
VILFSDKGKRASHSDLSNWGNNPNKVRKGSKRRIFKIEMEVKEPIDKTLVPLWEFVFLIDFPHHPGGRFQSLIVLKPLNLRFK